MPTEAPSLALHRDDGQRGKLGRSAASHFRVSRLSLHSDATIVAGGGIGRIHLLNRISTTYLSISWEREEIKPSA